MAQVASLRTCFTGIITLMLTQGLLWGDEIVIKDLPKPVTETIMARYPKGELTDARKTLEDKKDIYEVDLTDGGKQIEIAVFPDGTIDWVAVDLPVNDLPKKVVAAVLKKYPAAKMNHASSVYTVHKGKDRLEHYFVEISTKAGKKRDLDVTPVGEIEDDVPSKD